MAWHRFFKRNRFEQQLDSELQFHVEQLTREYIASGMDEFEARRRANASFGSTTSIKEEIREAWGWMWLDHLGQDLRYSARLLRQNPAFAIVAVAMLGVGIGTTSVMFTQINAVLWRPIPVRNPEELRTLSWTSPTLKSAGTFTYGTYLRMRDEMHLSDLGCAWRLRSTMSEWGPVTVQLVTGNYFPMLGVKPVIGRLLTPDDDQPGNGTLVGVISYRVWQRAYGGSADVLSKTLTVGGLPVQIVGVMSEGFAGLWPLEPREVMLPFATGSLLRTMVPPRNPSLWSCVEVVGRLPSGISEEQIRAEGQPFLQEEFASNPSKDSKDARLLVANVWQSRGAADLREKTAPPLALLMSTAGVILLITCTNIAGLLLARGHARQKELGTRLAVGAPRRRIVRQLVTESLAVSLAGGALGIFIAYAAAPFLPDLLGELSGRNWLTPTLTPGVSLSPDVRVLGFAVLLAVFAGVCFGLLPALRTTRLDLAWTMKQAAGGQAAGRFRMKTGKMLVAIQVGLSVLLLIGAGLFIRTLLNLRSVPIGYEREGLLFVAVDPSRSPATFIQDTLRSLESMPGVTSAAVSQWPIYNNAQPRLPMCIPRFGESGMDFEPVTPNFFQTWGVRMLQGRDFILSQDIGKNVIVNQTFVKTFFGTENPIGQQFGVGKCPGSPRTIIGVVADHLDRQRVEITPMVYGAYPLPRQVTPSTFAIRTSSSVQALVPTIRRLMQQSNANVDGDVMTGIAYVEREWRRERLIAGFLIFFGVLAQTISCLGIYGMLAYIVNWRTPEIGIRMALGARKHAVIGTVVRESLVPVGSGIVIGSITALLLARWVESFLFGVAKGDIASVGAASALLLATALIAAFLPSRRASQIDPMRALRNE
jgi:predicted permease